MNLQQLPVIVIAGPTAVGKTDLSIELAKHFNGAVINGDSLQVYRHLDIGTGKITPNEMGTIPHYMFDQLEVDQTYDVTQFRKQATDAIVAAYDQGYLPIVVGGSGFYLEGLLYERALGGPTSHDPKVRAKYEEIAQAVGPKTLWALLRQRDDKAAANIAYQDTRRVIRALEVIELTGEKFSEQKNNKESRFDEYLLVLDRPRDQLYQRINYRVELMADEGLEDEARWLYDQLEGQVAQSMKGIGYKEWWPYFEGEITKDQVIAQIQQNSRRYAKRQLTWFRNRMDQPHWLVIDDANDEKSVIQQAIQQVQTYLTERRNSYDND